MTAFPRINSVQYLQSVLIQILSRSYPVQSSPVVSFSQDSPGYSRTPDAMSNGVCLSRNRLDRTDSSTSLVSVNLSNFFPVCQ